MNHHAGFNINDVDVAKHRAGINVWKTIQFAATKNSGLLIITSVGAGSRLQKSIAMYV